MSLIQIPVFDGGLVTNADPLDLDASNGIVTESKNFDTDVPGKLVKRKGRGASTTITGTSINQIIKWVNDDLSSPIWICFDPEAREIRRMDADFLANTSDLTALTNATDISINTYGKAIRFANGIGDKAGIYQKIKRSFFFGNFSPDAFYYNEAAPQLPSTWLMQSISSIGKGNRAAGYYYYKFVPVFDGVQEMPMPDAHLFYTLGSSDKSLKIGLQINKGDGDFDPRITSIKVYRSFSPTASGDLDPVYYHIYTIPVKSESTHDDNIGSDVTLTPLDQEFYYSNTIIDSSSTNTNTTVAAGSTFNESLLQDWSNNDFKITFTNDGTGTEYAVNNNSGFPTNGIFTLTNSLGTKDVFNSPWTLIEEDPEGTQSPDIWEYRFNTGGTGGKNAVYNSGWDFHSGEADGYVIFNASNPAIEEVVINSHSKVVQLNNDLTETADFTVSSVTNAYRYTVLGDVITINFYDHHYTDGGLHPLGAKTKAIVNHKYSTFIDGRQFVGNVKLDPDGDNEDHSDWVIYSELLQPDILPIVNYIQVKDSQGGSITGLKRHMGSLIIFMEHGVYRLDVPSTDPSTYSLLESEENIGCTAPNSIINARDYIFFCGTDNAYSMDQGFNIQPITEPIKDRYQAVSNIANSRSIYDNKRSRILFRFGDEKQIIYVLDMKKFMAGKLSWSTIDLGSTNTADLFAIDENSKLFTIRNVET